MQGLSQPSTIWASFSKKNGFAISDSSFPGLCCCSSVAVAVHWLGLAADPMFQDLKYIFYIGTCFFWWTESILVNADSCRVDSGWSQLIFWLVSLRLWIMLSCEKYAPCHNVLNNNDLCRSICDSLNKKRPEADLVVADTITMQGIYICTLLHTITLISALDFCFLGIACCNRIFFTVPQYQVHLFTSQFAPLSGIYPLWFHF